MSLLVYVFLSTSRDGSNRPAFIHAVDARMTELRVFRLVKFRERREAEEKLHACVLDLILMWKQHGAN